MTDRSNIASQKPTNTPPAAVTRTDDPAPPPAPRTSSIVTGGAGLRDDAFARAMAALGGDEPAAPPPATPPPSPPPAQAGGSPPPAQPGVAPPTPTAGGTPPPAEPPPAAPTPEWERFLAEQRKLADDRAAVERTAQSLAAQQQLYAKQAEGYKKIAEGDVAGGLELLGTTYADLTTAVISGKGKKPAAAPAPATALPPEVQKDLEELKQWRAQQTQAQQQTAADQALQQVYGEISTIVTADTGDRWELLKAEPDYRARVYDKMVEAWEAAGRPATPPLTYEKAADTVEKQLTDEVQRRATSKKARTLLGVGEPSPAQPPPPPATGKSPANPPAPTANRGPTTLSSSMSAEVTRQPATADPVECRARALAVLEGKE